MKKALGDAFEFFRKKPKGVEDKPLIERGLEDKQGAAGGNSDEGNVR